MDEKQRKRILSKLDDMTRYVEELEMMLPSKEDYLLDLVKRRACEKTVEAAIETLVDVAAMIVSAEKLGLPYDEESIFDLLDKKKILDKKLCENAKKMKGFRNVLIHIGKALDFRISLQLLPRSISSIHKSKNYDNLVPLL